MNLTDLQNDVLSLLNEAANSPVGTLPDGTGGIATVNSVSMTTFNQITTYLNDAQNDLCRRCWRLDEVGTCTPAPETQFVAFAALTTPNSHVIRSARTVLYSGVALKEYDEAHLDNRYPSKATDATGTPLYYYRQGDQGIGLYPRPSNSMLALTVNGLATPVPLTSGSNTPSWLAADKHKLLSRYAAKEIAKKNAEDVNLGPRGDLWESEYEQEVAALLAELWQNDPYTAQAHFPAMPAGQ
jgi:hypothetical protein